MRYEDTEELSRLNAEPWQADLLKLNPDYCSWGPGEDYMTTKGGGWGESKIVKDWSEFGPWNLDDLNECVNFYFSVNRASRECELCEGNGYHEQAQRVVNTFYSHQNSEGESWRDKITQDEFEALQAKHRCSEFATVEEVNAANSPGSRQFGHDAINRFILIDARLKRLGLPKHCTACDGHGYIYTEDKAHASLTVWILHPRKGCSRGVEIQRLEQNDLPAAFAWLKQARDRNASRFAKLP